MWAAVTLSVLTATSAAGDAAISIDVHLRFNHHQPPAELVAAMQVEAAAIWKLYGIELRWQSPAGHNNGPTSFDVLLDQARYADASMALGDARLAAQSHEYVAIRLDRAATEHLLRHVTFEQVARLTGHASVQHDDEGRALGRVLAHELGHALLATREHQATGLMRSAFTGEELLTSARDSYRLSAVEITRLWSALAVRHHSADDY